VQREEYQSKALECARAAGQCRDPLERLRLLGLARQFVLLASHVGAWRGLGARSHDNEAAAGATASCHSGAAVLVSDASGLRSG
jgi:hypothetical protein